MARANGLTKRDWVVQQPEDEPAKDVASRGKARGYNVTPKHVTQIRAEWRVRPWTLKGGTAVTPRKLLKKYPKLGKAVPEIAGAVEEAIDDLGEQAPSAVLGRLVGVFPPGPQTPQERDLVLAVVELGLPRASQLLTYVRGRVAR